METKSKEEVAANKWIFVGLVAFALSAIGSTAGAVLIGGAPAAIIVASVLAAIFGMLALGIGAIIADLGKK